MVRMAKEELVAMEDLGEAAEVEAVAVAVEAVEAAEAAEAAVAVEAVMVAMEGVVKKKLNSYIYWPQFRL